MYRFQVFCGYVKPLSKLIEERTKQQRIEKDRKNRIAVHQIKVKIT